MEKRSARGKPITPIPREGDLDAKLHDKMACLSAEPLLSNMRKLKRAHVALTILLHSYVHSAFHDPSTPIIIPSPISIPLVLVSHKLSNNPVISYADLVLWNWAREDSTEPYDLSEIHTYTSFTQTTDESHFNMTSARIEILGGECLI